VRRDLGGWQELGRSGIHEGLDWDAVGIVIRVALRQIMVGSRTIDEVSEDVAQSRMALEHLGESFGDHGKRKRTRESVRHSFT
jgi:hypothetical protein